MYPLMWLPLAFLGLMATKDDSYLIVDLRVLAIRISSIAIIILVVVILIIICIFILIFMFPRQGVMWWNIVYHRNSKLCAYVMDGNDIVYQAYRLLFLSDVYFHSLQLLSWAHGICLLFAILIKLVIIVLSSYVSSFIFSS